MRQLNFGLIGLGSQGKIHLRNCLRIKEINLVGVADVSKKVLRLANKMGVKNVYRNYEDLLKDKRIDAVIISLPNFLHLDSTVKAAEAGKDILLEKPLARNVKEGKEILSSVRENGVKLMLGYSLRFHPALEKLHQKIVDGYFGEVEVVEAANVSHGPFTPSSDKTGPRQVPSWWFDKELAGGGALLDLGSHLINLLTWYFGEVTDVKSYLGYIFNMELEDVATCVLKFKDGPVATINVGWFSKDFVQSIQICGTAKNGYVRISSPNFIGLIWKDLRKKLGWLSQDHFYLELKYFVECLQKDEPPNPTGKEGLLDLQVVSIAYENASKFA